MGTLWWNGRFFTMEKESASVEAVYVENGHIIDTGSAGALRKRYHNRIVEEQNVHEAFVYPGFVDSHLHMIGHGEKLIRLDLSTVTSSQSMKEKLMEEAKKVATGEWIFAEGWNENYFPDRKIFHRRELDEISNTKPMLLSRVCRHAVLVNSEALKRAGITKETEDPPGGIIVRDTNGEPTGYLLDAAQELVKQAVPPVSNTYVKRALMTAVADMHKRGLVGGHTEDLSYYNGFTSTFQAFQSVIDGKKCKFRAHLLVHHEALDEMHAKGYHSGSVSPFLEFGAMKIFADGALGARTALLSHPYNDAPETSGVAIHSSTELAQLVDKARKMKMAVAIHTIGDKALEMALDAIEAHPLTHGRDRLIHVQVARPDLIERMKKLPVILDLQPRFVVSDFPWVEERLGSERLRYAFAWRTLLEAGIYCAGGSDAPIEPVDPLLGIHAAITRKKPVETEHPGYLSEQKLSPFEAIKLYTAGSAYAIEKESSRGKIMPGYVADFTILDTNLFTCEPDEIIHAKVLKTVVDNSVMYEQKA
ncbi:amidohydrolase [Halalkalibacterium ligniniphilum]|uniref:amidohydrolase n=1 Tax=Halalkalibacterium ligniniphilum TaxID=1134413 RepID=UPI00034755C5|nr:amidohydrolase [Halalkalibacterium ligniniphilum]